MLNFLLEKKYIFKFRFCINICSNMWFQDKPIFADPFFPRYVVHNTKFPKNI